MIFLVDYDRALGRLVSIKAFDSADRIKARDERLSLELALNSQGVEREVVLLEAADEIALRRTHRRYFETLSELTGSTVG